MQNFTVEYTDTFGGEANYSWVKRVKLAGNFTEKGLMRAARRAIGLEGVRGRWEKYGVLASDVAEFTFFA